MNMLKAEFRQFWEEWRGNSEKSGSIGTENL